MLPYRLPVRPIQDDAAYRRWWVLDPTPQPWRAGCRRFVLSLSARACACCGKRYRGPSLYCSPRCEVVADLGAFAGAFADGRCPDCGSQDFRHGPVDGDTHSVECAGCRQRFSLVIVRSRVLGAARLCSGTSES